MKPSDVVGLPIKAGAALRDARVFHPEGVLATGRLERVADSDIGLPLESGDVLARISKGVGVPGKIPDVLGLAFRMDPHAGDDSPWDVLLASALGDRGPTRFIPFPARSLDRAVFSTLQPLDRNSQSWWLRAELVSPTGGVAASVADVRDWLTDSELVFDLTQARYGRPFEPVARLTLSVSAEELTARTLGFDPTVNTTSGVRPGPGWLRNIRASAYRRSRQGRR